jgi:hypothetical protein
MNGTHAPAPGLPLTDQTPAQACPKCGRNIWYQRLTYRECQHCQYKEGPTPQEILSQGEVSTAEAERAEDRRRAAESAVLHLSCEGESSEGAPMRIGAGTAGARRKV